MTIEAIPLTETHHAVLFALLARQVLEQAPEAAVHQDSERDAEPAGLRAIRMAVRRYGEQRGGRMAQRALADGQPLTMENYLAYSEWMPTHPGSDDAEMHVEDSGYRLRIHICPWNSAWLENDLLPYGRLYCLEIDAALVRGFNPDLRIEVNSTLSNDQTASDFLYVASAASPAAALRAADALRQTDLSRRVMPWDYHCAHLYYTCAAVLAEELGAAGVGASQAALQLFGARYGAGAVAAITAYHHTDFNQA